MKGRNSINNNTTNFLLKISFYFLDIHWTTKSNQFHHHWYQLIHHIASQVQVKTVFQLYMVFLYTPGQPVGTPTDLTADQNTNEIDRRVHHNSPYQHTNPIHRAQEVQVLNIQNTQTEEW